MKQIIKHVKQQEKHLSSSSKENASDMAWPGGQKFSGYICRTKFFSTIAGNFYPIARIKIFGGIIFLDTTPKFSYTELNSDL